MNKTLYGHTPNVNGLLNLDHGVTHIHKIDPIILFSTQTHNNIYFRFNTDPEGKVSVRW